MNIKIQKILIGIIVAVALVTFSVPVIKTQLNKLFGDNVTTKYVATVEKVNQDKAVIVWKDDLIPFPDESFIDNKAEVSIKDYNFVRVGDTFDIEVTEPGVLKTIFNSANQKKVAVTDHNLNWFRLVSRFIDSKL